MAEGIEQEVVGDHFSVREESPEILIDNFKEDEFQGTGESPVPLIGDQPNAVGDAIPSLSPCFKSKVKVKDWFTQTDLTSRSRSGVDRDEILRNLELLSADATTQVQLKATQDAAIQNKSEAIDTSTQSNVLSIDGLGTVKNEAKVDMATQRESLGIDIGTATSPRESPVKMDVATQKVPEISNLTVASQTEVDVARKRFTQDMLTQYYDDYKPEGQERSNDENANDIDRDYFTFSSRTNRGIKLTLKEMSNADIMTQYELMDFLDVEEGDEDEDEKEKSDGERIVCPLKIRDVLVKKQQKSLVVDSLREEMEDFALNSTYTLSTSPLIDRTVFSPDKQEDISRLNNFEQEESFCDNDRIEIQEILRQDREFTTPVKLGLLDKEQGAERSTGPGNVGQVDRPKTKKKKEVRKLCAIT